MAVQKTWQKMEQVKLRNWNYDIFILCSTRLVHTYSIHVKDAMRLDVASWNGRWLWCWDAAVFNRTSTGTLSICWTTILVKGLKGYRQNQRYKDIPSGLQCLRWIRPNPSCRHDVEITILAPLSRNVHALVSRPSCVAFGHDTSKVYWDVMKVTSTDGGWNLIIVLCEMLTHHEVMEHHSLWGVKGVVMCTRFWYRTPKETWVLNGLGLGTASIHNKNGGSEDAPSWRSPKCT